MAKSRSHTKPLRLLLSLSQDQQLFHDAYAMSSYQPPTNHKPSEKTNTMDNASLRCPQAAGISAPSPKRKLLMGGHGSLHNDGDKRRASATLPMLCKLACYAFSIAVRCLRHNRPMPAQTSSVLRSCLSSARSSCSKCLPRATTKTGSL